MKRVAICSLAGLILGYVAMAMRPRFGPTELSIATPAPQSPEASHVDRGAASELSTMELPGDEPAPTVATYTEALAITNPLRRSYALDRYFSQATVEKYAEIFEQVRSKPNLFWDIYQLLFYHWVQRDPADAAKHVTQLPPGSQRIQSLFVLTTRWAAKDPAALREWAMKNLGDPDERASALAKVTRATLQPAADTPHSLKEILATMSGASRSTALQKYFQEKKDAEVPAALDEAVAALKQDRGQIGRALLDRLTKLDPEKALDWVRKHKMRMLLNTDETTAAANAMDAFVKRDPTAARGYVESLPPGQKNARLFDRFIFDRLTTDPDAVPSLVEDAKRVNPNETMGETLREWLRVNPELASAELRRELNDCFSPDDANRRASFAENVLQPWSQKDPAAVAQFCASLPADMHSRIFGNLATVWCAQDPESAVQWANGLPAGTARNSAMAEFTYAWAQHDTTRVTTWLKALPVDAGRTSAVEGFACAAMNLDPDSALAWIRTIPSETDRNRVLSNAFGSWRRKDAKTAFQWLDSGQLKDTEAQALKSQDRYR